MTKLDILRELEGIASEDDFAFRCIEVVDGWEKAGVGIESIEVLLRFMEEHPSIDYGMPGHLVHFIERFHDADYSNRVVESIRRRPTPHTAWLLNRVINGTKTPDERPRLIGVMEAARSHPLADDATVGELKDFLDWQKKHAR